MHYAYEREGFFKYTAQEVAFVPENSATNCKRLSKTFSLVYSSCIRIRRRCRRAHDKKRTKPHKPRYTSLGDAKQQAERM
jgi:hypothetical protein